MTDSSSGAEKGTAGCCSRAFSFPCSAYWEIFCAMSSGERIWSAKPAAMALFGMPLNLAVEGSCTNTNPPVAFTALAPLVPSVPVPDRITQILSSFFSSASE